MCIGVNVERLKTLIAEYGKVALFTYFALFAASLAGFAAAISLGFEVESAKDSAGLLAASYIATKVIQPLRIGVTLALTPFVARFSGRAPVAAKLPAERPQD